MFEVLPLLRADMSGSGSWRSALFLAIIMIIIGPLQMNANNLANQPIIPNLEDLESPRFTPVGAETFINLPGDDQSYNGFTVDVPSNAPITDLQLEVEPAVLQKQYGFTWDSNAIWSNSDATKNGTVVSGTSLTGTTAGTIWDFNTGLQGWTVSSSTYVGRYTSNTCGYNGSSGGSLKTQAQSTPEHATSPVLNLAGTSSMPLHAWIKQGSSSCGEEADSGEDLKVQYKATSGNWVDIQTFAGATPGGSAQQWSTNLPAAALHATTQIRMTQIYGSGTCCDYWFIDDVHLASPPESNWLSPTIGWDSSSTQVISRSTYAPLNLDVEIPDGAFLNWTIMDASGNPILGAQGSNDVMIPLNLLDYEMYPKIRILLEFRGSPRGTGIPVLHSISGDGSFSSSLRGGVTDMAWNLTCSSNGDAVPMPSGGIELDGDCSVTSPWYTTLSPTDEITGMVSLNNGLLQIRTDESMNWTNISSPSMFTYQGDPLIYNFQFRIEPDDTAQQTQFTSYDYTVKSGKFPAQPAVDFGMDGILEWGGSDSRVGSWGWQDRFQNGEEIISVNPGISGSASTKAWIPRDDIQSFSFGIMAETGTLSSLFVKIGGQTIADWSYDMAKSDYIIFNQTQLDDLQFAATNTASSVGFLGASFIEVEFEVIGTGGMKMGGLSAPYPISMDIDADEQSSFVLGINNARSSLADASGQHLIPIEFVSSTSGGLSVTLTGVNSSADVTISNSYMDDPVPVLTPSQRWHTMHTSFSVTSSSAALARLDVVGIETHATWLLPIGGGTPIGQGDSHLIELHPDSWLNVNESGDDVDVAIKFRIEPGWDDETYMTASTRMVLSNGVISIPATHSWGAIGGSTVAYENDLELKSVTFTTSVGELPSNEYYLPAGQQLDISVDVGFEGIDSDESFAPGEAIVELFHGSTLVANTTSLDGDTWNFTDVVPFTNGVLNWKIEVTPLNGSGTTSEAVFERVFFADSVSPSVYWSNVAPYDHRTPSTTQTIQLQITDQPILPSNVEAMVWREWVNDYDFSGMPNPGEFEPFTLLMPNDMTALIGQYTLLIDDAGGNIGDKVAVYLTGSDAAGHPLEDNGTDEEGKHLLMYQLNADGPPSIASNSFSWDGGKKNWLHPQMDYAFEVSMSEPNGGSDLSTVTVELASKQGSDKLPISWDFYTGNCTTTSIHLIVDDCEMMGINGPAGPYETELTLRIEFHLAWTLPDLGDTRREPSLRVVDRAGQIATKSFPELRWRFSAEMTIPDETVTLYLNQGSLVSDGARMGPSSTFEVGGEVLFIETSTKPTFDCNIELLFNGQSTVVTSINGLWSTGLQAPATSGKIALTWGVNCISGQGIDGTDQSSVRWILIDGTGPEPVEILNPRPGSELKAEVYEVRVALDEEGGLDVDSLQLIWWVEDAETGDYLRNGVESMTLEGDEIDGLQLEVYAEVDLSDITSSMLERQMILFIKIDGRDLADNDVLGMGATPAGSLVGQWDLEWLKPEFSLETSSVSYTRLLVEVDQSTSVKVLVNNIGSLDGNIDAVISVSRIDGSTEVIQRTNVEVPAGGVGLISLDWAPTTRGVQWIDVELDNGETAKGPTIDVRPAREQSFTDKLFGDVNPIIGSAVLLIVISIIVTALLWAKKATTRRGSRSEYDWDEYSSEIEDDEYEYEDNNYSQSNVSDKEYMAGSIAPSQSLSAAASALGVSDSVESNDNASEESEWVKGSDGYWWYHDKETNEWWYKNEDGEIVQFS